MIAVIAGVEQYHLLYLLLENSWSYMADKYYKYCIHSKSCQDLQVYAST